MISKFRIKLARLILGKYCLCYKMGYHNMVDFQQRSTVSQPKSESVKK